MSRPVAGQEYTIVKGDTLWDIAQEVYGSGRKYTIIWDANKSNLRSDDPHWIFPGEKLWIPNDGPMEQVEASVAPKVPAGYTGDPDELGLYIGDTHVPTESLSMLRTLDTPSNGWSAVMRFNGSEDHLFPLIQPYGLQKCKTYVGSRYLEDSLLYVVNPSWDSSRGKIRLDGFSKTVDFIDSQVEPPFRKRNVTFGDWIKEKAGPFGLGVEIDVEEDKKYTRVTMEKTDTAFDHFHKLAEQRSYLIANTPSGGLRVFDAPEDGPVVATFRESTDTPMENGEGGYNSRNRFRKYTGYGTGPRKNIASTQVDAENFAGRMRTLTVDDTDESDIAKAVRVARNRALEEALTLTIPIRSFYNEKNKLYEPGQFVLAQSDRLFIREPFKFLIRDVEFNQTGDSRQGKLTVIPPTVYTGGELVTPWD